MNIVVIGIGYVGLSLAVLLAQRHRVTAVDLDAERVADINARRSPLLDADVTEFLATRPLQLTATTALAPALIDADWVIVATPTDYDPGTDAFDTSSVDAVVDEVLRSNQHACVVIKSTIPVGYVDTARRLHQTQRIVFSPEFLREGKALHDNLHPARIIVGDTTAQGERLAQLLQEAAQTPKVPVLLVSPAEAEAIKLFANTYLAMRVAFFNELDTFAATHGLNPRQIIDGVGLDPRIGQHYNNPSFGYGGYCLPKDTRQLLANYRNVPQNLVRAVVEANETRKAFIADTVVARQPHCVGVHRLAMKAGSDNWRASSVLDVVQRLRAQGIQVLVYEPLLGLHEPLHGAGITHDLADFKARCDLIIANRQHPELSDVADKVMSRDLYGRDA